MGLGKNLRKDNLIPKKGEHKDSSDKKKDVPNKESKEVEYDADGIAILLPGESKGKAAARRIKEKKSKKKVAEEKKQVAKKSSKPNEDTVVSDLDTKETVKEMPVSSSKTDDNIEYDADGIAKLLPGESRGKAAARRIKEKKALEEQLQVEEPTIALEDEIIEDIAEVDEEEDDEDVERIEESLLMIVFQLGKEEYAVDINQIKEVVITPAVSQIPHEADHILGVANIRGNVIAVIDLALRFGLIKESTFGSEGSYTLVIESEEFKVGLFVESVPNTISLVASNIEPASSVMSENKKDAYIKGIIKVEDRMIMLMDIVSFLEIENSEEEVEVLL